MASGIIYQTVVEVLSGLTTTTSTTTTSTTTTSTVPGSICYGHDTGVEEDFIEDFTGKWDGDAAISGSGDSEKLTFTPGDHKKLIAPHWYGTDEAAIQLNKYQTGNNVSIYYKTAGSIAGIEAASWTPYAGKFTSSGFVDVLLGRGYDPFASTTTTTTSTTSTVTTVTTVTTTTTVGAQTAWSMDDAIGGTWADSSYASEINYRLEISSTDLSNGGTNKEIRIEITAHGTSDSVIDGASIGQRSGVTDDFSDTPTRITFNGGSNSVTVTAGTSVWSDWIEFDLDDTAHHLIHLYMGQSTSYYPYVADTSYRERPATGDDTMETTVSYGATGYHYLLETIEIRDSQTIAAEALAVMSGDML